MQTIRLQAKQTNILQKVSAGFIKLLYPSFQQIFKRFVVEYKYSIFSLSF
ncbi:HTH-type transcriptional regulator [Bacillus subtilis]|nr:HTH-type transcriptional regulator [Bacillus subtilis]RPK04515.1 hypothetical protein EH11_00920 [Bacillus subtilis]RPK14322.1 hypothetical protein EH5_00947 [Bacillus subtilis]RUS10187.1 hypothetical protein EFW59_00919 [Bacillus subtilis]CCU60311.1 hypothetical protein BSUBE1_3680 [Bacillus subtilis E1]